MTDFPALGLLAGLIKVALSSAAPDCNCDPWLPSEICDAKPSVDADADRRDARALLARVGSDRIEHFVFQGVADATSDELTHIHSGLLRLHQSAKANDSAAMFDFAAMLPVISPRQGTDATAECWLRRSAAAGNLDAMFTVGRQGARLFGSGFGEITDAKDFAFARRAAQLGHGAAQQFVDEVEAGVRRWQSRGGDDPEEIRKFANSLRFSSNDEETQAEAWRLLARAADLGNQRAMLQFGTHMIGKDNDRAASYLRRAIESFPGEVHRKLGDISACEGDVDAAKEHFRIAAEEGDVEAEYAMAELEEFGLPQDNCMVSY